MIGHFLLGQPDGDRSFGMVAGSQGGIQHQQMLGEARGQGQEYHIFQQINVLGFTRAVVLAYTIPGASDLIAYRLRNTGFNFNSIDFTVDRYTLDNQLTQHYDIAAAKFDPSHETTFDRYPALPSQFVSVGAVDYAVSIAFDEINGKTISEIIANHGGLDGDRTFQDGETLVFAQQEFRDIFNAQTYNTGWTNILDTWDSGGWSSELSTIGDEWDASNYVPGYEEHLLNPTVINQRIGIWKINISGNMVKLTFVQSILANESVFVRYGTSYSGENIYYDPIVKVGNTVPNYSPIHQVIKSIGTTFDSRTTLFYDNRDVYVGPEENNHYIKFPQTGVFV